MIQGSSKKITDEKITDEKTAGKKIAGNKITGEQAGGLAEEGVARILLDSQGNIKAFTPEAKWFYGFREGDLGRPLDELKTSAKCMPTIPHHGELAFAKPVEDEVVDREGQFWIRCISLGSRPDVFDSDVCVTFRKQQDDVDSVRLSDFEDRSARQQPDAMHPIQQGSAELDTERRQIKAIADASPALIGYVDRDERYQFVNAAYAVETGKSVEQIVGERVETVLGKHRYDQVRPHLQAGLCGQRSDCELVLQSPDQSEPVYKEITYVPDVDDRGQVAGCHVLVVDVTQQRKDAVSAVERQHQLQLALKTAKMGAWEWDAVNDRVKCTESLLSIFGYPAEKLSKSRESLLSVVHADDRPVLQSQIESAERGDNGDFEAEYRVVHGETGDVVWTYSTAAIRRNDQGNLINITSVVQDITEQRRSEEKLAANEHRLQRVVDGASVGIAFAKTNGEIVTANDAALRMLGITRSQFDREGFNWTNSIRLNDRPLAKAIIEDLRSTGQMPPRELLLRHPSGNLQPVQVSSLSVSSDDEEHVVFLVDLSEQKRYEHSLDEARRHAETANKTKSEFLANMSHEIRTPMSAIIGYLDILSRNLTQPDDLKCVSIIRHNSRFLLEIINDILDISKIEAGKLVLQKKRFRPEKLLVDVRSLMDVRAAEKQLELNVKVEGEIPKTIRSDDKRLKQILVNLLGNAIKFTESGSVDLHVEYLPETNSLAFDVIDTGIGMHPTMLTELFQPFTQGDSSLSREFGGTGLGLNISQRLARLLGGEIIAESESGKGSKFSLRIAVGSLNNVPMVVPDLSVLVSSLGDQDTKRLPSLSGRILVVDDRRDIRHIAHTIVVDAGATASEAEDGRQAIEVIQQAIDDGNPYDLILMDMQMPVLDGYAATRQLRQSGYDKPIVALTAHAMRGDRQKCIEAGCTDYLTKPLDRRPFLSMLASYLPKISAPEETRARRILIVEDLIEAADALAMLLECDEHIVEKAYDGASAIELAEDFRPELVLLDLGLPDMTGFEVLDAIRKTQSKKDTVFVALTGRDNAAETDRAGFAHHMVKPVDIEELEHLVAKLD